MRLAEGAYAILGDLPQSATTLVEVPVGAGDSLGTRIHRLSSVSRPRTRRPPRAGGRRLARPRRRRRLRRRARRRAARPRPRTTAVVWFDAHPDLHSPRSSESGAFSGMVLRALLGDGTDELRAREAGPARAALDAGPHRPRRRAAPSTTPRTPGSRAAASRTVSSLDLAPRTSSTAVAATGATEVYLHVDLDVLDPGTLEGLLDPQPFGLEPTVLIADDRALKAALHARRRGLCAFAPVDAAAAADDMGTMLRIVGALAR